MLLISAYELIISTPLQPEPYWTLLHVTGGFHFHGRYISLKTRLIPNDQKERLLETLE